jgi:hypothetical protein
MAKAVDISGQRFGRLVVTRRVGAAADRHSLWLCRCDCGNDHTVNRKHLRDGQIKSCGCAHHFGKHGYNRNGQRHYLYTVWAHMRDRCNNPKNAAFERYGGRGIKVYEPWNESFTTFLADILAEIGERPSPEYSLDRFPDNDRGYEPGNLRWATAKEQASTCRPKRWTRWSKPKQLAC